MSKGQVSNTAVVHSRPSARQLADEIAALTDARDLPGASQAAAQLLQMRPGHRRALRALTRHPLPGIDLVAQWEVLAQQEPEDAEPYRRIAQLKLSLGEARAAAQAAAAALEREPTELHSHDIRLAALKTMDDAAGLAHAWRALAKADASHANAFLRTELSSGWTNTRTNAALLGALRAEGEVDDEALTRVAHYEAVLAAEANAADCSKDYVRHLETMVAQTLLQPDNEALLEALYLSADKVAKASTLLAGDEAAQAAKALIAAKRYLPLAYQILAKQASDQGAYSLACEYWAHYFDAGGEDDARARLAALKDTIRAPDLLVSVKAYARYVERFGASAGQTAREMLLDRLAIGATASLSDENFAQASLILGHGLTTPGAREYTAFDKAWRACRKAVKEKLEALAESDGADEAKLLAAMTRLEPQNTSTFRKMGRLLMRRGSYAEAAPVWEALTQLEPEATEAWLQLARAHRKCSAVDTCNAAVMQLLALEPTHNEGQTIAQWVKEKSAALN